MSGGSVRLLLAIAVLCILGGGAYVVWTIWSQAMMSAGTGTVQVPMEQQFQQAESTAPPIAAPSATAAPLTQAEQAAELTSIGNAIDAYKGQVGSYPPSVKALEEENPEAQVNDSYNYGLDAPENDMYALCTVTVDHVQYECISSELGSGDPFTFSVSSSEMFDFSKWQWIQWTSSTPGEESIDIPFPPDWNYATSTYRADLDGVDSQGNNVIIGRINLQNWQMTPGESFAEFEQTAFTDPESQIATSTLTTISGFPAYILVGSHIEGNIHYYFLSDLIQQNNYVFQINIFIDETVSNYFIQALESISNSIRVVPSSGE